MNLRLEIQRKKVEVIRVRAAKAEQEFKIEECLDQIERLKKAMAAQDEHASKLEKEIVELENRNKGE